MNTIQHDDCCSKRLAACLIKDEYTLMSFRRWNCPVCETEWRAQLHMIDQGGGVLHWTPHVHIELFQTATSGR